MGSEIYGRIIFQHSWLLMICYTGELCWNFRTISKTSHVFRISKISNIREIIFQTFSFFQKTVHTINRKARKRGIVLETTEKNTIFTKLSKSFKSITWLKKNAAFRSTVAVVLTVIVFGVLVNFLDKGIQLLVSLIG